MHFRPATPADVPALLPMVEQICAFHESLDPAKYGFVPNVADRYRTWLIDRATDPRSVLLVAERAPAGATPKPTADEPRPMLVGFLVGTIEREISIYRLGEYGFIHDLWVEPPYRHEGIARQLVMLAVEHFGQLGVRQIRLDTAAANEPARLLFTACGFRPSTVEMLLELPPEKHPNHP